jgi:transcriptional regulator with XRE-family HTH domain
MIGLEYACQVFNVGNKDLAEKLKISPPNISAWLKGNREIPAKYIPELSKIFKGLSMEYFQKELTYIDELKIRIHHIETMDWDERHGELVVPDGDNYDNMLIDEFIDDYEDQLKSLYSELNKNIKMNSYQERVSQLLERVWALDSVSKYEIFKDRNPEEFIVSKLNNYLDYAMKFEVNGLNSLDTLINYLNSYHGVDQENWESQELFPNEKLLSFYKDLREVLVKHRVL